MKNLRTSLFAAALIGLLALVSMPAPVQAQNLFDGQAIWSLAVGSNNTASAASGIFTNSGFQGVALGVLTVANNGGATPTFAGKMQGSSDASTWSDFGVSTNAAMDLAGASTNYIWLGQTGTTTNFGSITTGAAIAVVGFDIASAPQYLRFTNTVTGTATSNRWSFLIITPKKYK